MKSKLYYDSGCPICNNYVKLLKKKLSTTQIQFIATSEPLDDFKFTTPSGETYYGVDATKQLAAQYPKVLDYFWMLPTKYKSSALTVAYKTGSVVRKILKKTGCGCGKKR
jgi:hypothetical protein